MVITLSTWINHHLIIQLLFCNLGQKIELLELKAQVTSSSDNSPALLLRSISAFFSTILE